MKKINAIVLSIILGISLIGCNNKGSNNIFQPNIKRLDICGTWIIDEILEQSDGENIDINKEIKIDINAFELLTQLYSGAKYRLKIVNGSYLVSYERNIKAEELIPNNEQIEVFSGISNDKPVFELILESDKVGYLAYNKGILKIRKIKEETNINNLTINDDSEMPEGYYNSDVGILLGLKTVGVNGTYEESYRTLWISFQNGTLNPIVEKENIIYPRMNGIWKLEKISNKQQDKRIEYFITGPVDEINNKKENTDMLEPGYKTINFVANDYIAIEKYNIGNSNEKQILSVGNINSKNGIELIDIYPKEYKNIFSNEYLENYNKLSSNEKSSVVQGVNYSNYTIKRNNGKWNLVSSIKGINENIDYYSKIYPNDKLLNFDTLNVNWKTLKGELPFIEDAYTSPTARILIAIFEDRLTIYEIENGMIKGNPLANVELNNGEEVIMAEWATDNYVETWKRAFSDGIIINEKED